MKPTAAARWRRTGGAAFAAALTLLPLAALYWRAAPQPAAAAHEPVTYLSQWRPAVAVDATPGPAPAAAPARAARRVAVPGPRPAPAIAARSVSAAITPSPAPTNTVTAQPLPQPAAVAEAPQPPASAALKLDSTVMRAAAAGGKSGARSMAEASGAYFGSDPVAQTERLGRAVAETVRLDCVRQGGSLLSIFVIAYEVARDKCK